MNLCHRLAGWLASLSFFILVFSGSAYADNCTAFPQNNQLYSIINLGSGLALDVNTSDTSGAPNVITYEYWGGTNQQWYLRDQGNGYWRIESAYNGQVLDVLDVSTSDGANVVTYDAWDADNQRWQLKHSTTGAFNIVARHSGKSLTVAGADNVANVYQNTDTANSSQRWFFNPVNGSCGGSSGGGNNNGVSGFASQSGSDGLSTTSGGGNATPITVNSCDALASALSASGPAVIQVPNTTINCHTPAQTVAACPLDCAQWNDPGKTWYRLPVGNQTCSELGSPSNATVNVTRNDRRIIVASNKTLVGMGPNAKISGASLILDNVQNIIIRNLAIADINPALVEAGDGVTVDDSSHIWIDHVAFSMISDGYTDISDSNNVTLSWNRFYGYNPQVCANQHWYTNLVDNSRVTFHHNFWDRAAGRNPKIEGNYARTHLYNNYWKNITYFSIGASDGAQVKVENNYFENSARPQWDQGGAYFDASGNVYTGSSADDTNKADGSQVFSDLTLYPYSLDDPQSLGAQVDGGTGPQ